MSAIDLRAATRRRRRFSTRFLRSELWLIFGRRRNWAGLATLTLVPLILAVALKIWPAENVGADFVGQITENGMFVALASLSIELPLFLPIAVAAIAADSLAGEANLGTLRYLLTVPAQRTRVLAVKYTAMLIFTFAAVFLVVAVSLLLGLALFGVGPARSFGGTELSLGSLSVRLLAVACYAAVMLSAVGAIGLFVSSLTEQPIGGTVAIMILILLSAILTSIPQLSWLHDYLFVSHWTAYGELMRDQVTLRGPLLDGLLNAGAYNLVFLTAAWARFTGRDITN
jgi:ABC-2 type transport system permease protein